MKGVTRQAAPGKHPSAGFTLSEVAVATMVLGLVMASAMIGLRVGFGMIEVSRDNTLASQILQSEMENLRLMNWKNISALEEGSFEMDDSFYDTPHAARYNTYRRVEDISDTLRLITLEVEWDAFNGRSATRRYSTYFSKEGFNDYHHRSPQF